MADDEKTNIQKLSDQGPRQPSSVTEPVEEESSKEEAPTVEAEVSQEKEQAEEKPKKVETEASEESKAENVEEDKPESLGESLSEELGVDIDIDEANNSSEVNVDDVIAEADPDFKKEMDSLGAEDFSKATVNTDAGVPPVIEEGKVPSAFRAFLSNLPQEVKIRYSLAIGIILVMVPLAAFIFMGKVLPTFELPYVVSMDELTQKSYNYPTDGVRVPLFDDFRSKSFTFPLPKTMINLKAAGDGSSSYGEFEFFLNLRDKDIAEQIKLKQSEIIDLIQRTLEEVTWKELQSPIGKERVKKVIRHRVNEFLQGNLVLGVYYRSVILQK